MHQNREKNLLHRGLIKTERKNEKKRKKKMMGEGHVGSLAGMWCRHSVSVDRKFAQIIFKPSTFQTKQEIQQMSSEWAC